MRILVLTNRVPYPLKDGGNIAVMQMLESMLQCGFEVKLLSLNTNKHFVETNDLPPIFKTLGLETTPINTDVNLKSAFLNLFTGTSYNAERFYSEEFKNLVLQTMREGEYDIVLFESIYTSMYVDYVKQRYDVKCILRPHNIEYEIWNNASLDETFFKKRYFRFLAKRLRKFELEHWEKFDAIVPISEQDEKVIRKLNHHTSDYLTLSTAIDIKKINADNSEADINKVFHLGSMDWTPNQQAMEWFLRNVWDRIVLATPATFYMAGRKMPEEFFNYRSERINVVGEIDDAFDFMNDKQVMVVPLFAGSGVRIKILEGMAAAKTIITTTLGVQGIAATDKVHLLLANSANDFIEALTWCIQNEKSAKEIGNNARKLIEEKYSKENFEEQLKAFLIKIAG